MNAGHVRVRTLPAVSEVLAGLAGFLFWTPAMSLPAGGARVQLLELMAPAFCAWILLARKVAITKEVWRVALFAAALTVTWILVTVSNSQPKVIYLVYYVAIIAPFLVMAADVMTSNNRLRWLLTGFFIGNAFTILAASLQMAGGGALISALRNNTNFQILDQGARPSALFPEASTLAHVLSLSTILLVILRRARKRNRQLAMAVYPPMPNWLIWTLLLGNLVVLFGTQSTSIFALLPFFAVLYAARERGSPSRRVLAFVSMGVIGSAILLLYLGTYEARGTSAENSAANRASTILAVAEWAKGLDWNGRGLGHNSDITDVVRQVQAKLGIQVTTVEGGINSLVFARVFEEGITGLLSYVVVLYIMGRVFLFGLRRLSEQDYLRFVIGSWSFVISLGASGYRGLLHLWLVFPCGLLLIGARQRALDAALPDAAQAPPRASRSQRRAPATLAPEDT